MPKYEKWQDIPPDVRKAHTIFFDEIEEETRKLMVDKHPEINKLMEEMRVEEILELLDKDIGFPMDDKDVELEKIVPLILFHAADARKKGIKTLPKMTAYVDGKMERIKKLLGTRRFIHEAMDDIMKFINSGGPEKIPTELHQLLEAIKGMNGGKKKGKGAHKMFL